MINYFSISMKFMKKRKVKIAIASCLRVTWDKKIEHAVKKLYKAFMRIFL